MLASIFRQRITSTLKSRSLSWAAYAICAVALMLLVIGCGSQPTSSISQPTQTEIPNPTPTPTVAQPSQDILGKWNGPCSGQNFMVYGEPIEALVFYSNGTFLLGRLGVIGPGGEYSFVDNQHIQLTIGGFPNVYRFSLSGNTLVLIAASGNSCTLNRTS